MCSPLLPPLHPRRLPTVADVIAESPSVRTDGPLCVAWRLVAPLTLADCGPFLGLAIAIGCLCRAVSDLTGDELEPPGAPSLYAFTGNERAPSLSDFTGNEPEPPCGPGVQ